MSSEFVILPSTSFPIVVSFVSLPISFVLFVSFVLGFSIVSFPITSFEFVVLFVFVVLFISFVLVVLSSITSFFVNIFSSAV